MKIFVSLFLVLTSTLLLGCNQDATDPDSDRGAIGKADLVGSCSNSCGDQSASGACWCDDSCSDFGDCCGDIALQCEVDECSLCLDSGGTWQPEADECTTDCAIQDISCFVDSCPSAPANECSLCLDSGGTWQPEAGECTTDCAIQDISCFVDSCPS